MLERVFLHLLNMSFTGGIVILAVMLLRLLLKKAPRRFSYLLWAVVLFRLLCPFTLESAFSLVRVNPAPLTEEIITSDTPHVDTGLPIVDNAINGALTDNVPDTPITPPQNTPQTPPQNIPQDTIPQTPPQTITPDVPPSTPDVPQTPSQDVTQDVTPNTPSTTPVTTPEKVSPWHIAAWVWIGGIGVMAIYSVVSLWRLRRQLVGAMRLRDNVWLADHIDTAFVLGLFRPKIYLPSTVKEEERQYILLHEQTHIRHGDHIMRLIAFIVLAIYWFHPLVWVAFLLSTRDMEMACDESVLKKLGADVRTAYSQSLLNFATGRRRIAATPLAFGEDNPKSRIRNILSYKKPTLWAIIAGVTACCVAAVCLLTTATPAKPTDDDTNKDNVPVSVEEAVLGDWYYVRYSPDDERPRLAERQIHITKTDEGLLVQADSLSYELGGTDVTYNGDGFTLVKSVRRSENLFKVEGNTLVPQNETSSASVLAYSADKDILYNEGEYCHYGRNRALPDVEQYRPYLNTWKYVTHYWREGNEYFGRQNWGFMVTNTGLLASSSYVTYAPDQEEPRSRFQYNGKYFDSINSGEGGSVLLEQESENVFTGVGHNYGKSAYRFVLDPENETLTVTETPVNDAPQTTTYDTKMSAQDGVFVELGDITPDETGVWHRIVYSEDGEDVLTEYELTIERENNTLWYTLKVWDYVPQSADVVALKDIAPITYDGKTYVAVKLDNTGQKKSEIDEYGRYTLQSSRLGGEISYEPREDCLTVGDYDKFLRARIMPMEAEKLVGDWYYLQYTPNSNPPRFKKEYIYISKAGGLRVQVAELYYTFGGTDFTYDGNGFTLTTRTDREGTLSIEGDELISSSATLPNLVYWEEDNVLYGDEYCLYGRSPDLQDIEQYRQYLKDWNYVTHYRYGDSEAFGSSSCEFSITNTGLYAGMGQATYGEPTEYTDPDHYRFKYNGKIFAFAGGGGGNVWLKSTSENVLTSYEPNDPYEYALRFELDPEKETLTETQIGTDGVVYTTVYDTKMSAEDGIFVELGDLSKPTDPPKDENDEANTWYAPYLKEWKQVTHYWQNDIEHFTVSSWTFTMTDAGLMGYYYLTSYIAIEDGGDDGSGIAFVYNGKHFTYYEGSNNEVYFKVETDTVLSGRDPYRDSSTTYRLVLDPEKETLTVTETGIDGVSYLTVHDTKMSAENGVFVDKGNLDEPAESLQLIADGAVRFVPQDADKNAELLLAKEDAVTLAAILNAQTVEKKAYKGLGDYIFTLGGQKFSVNVEECYFNLLDENNIVMMRSIKLSGAYTAAFKSLLHKATEA